jgi:hypothetical protein
MTITPHRRKSSNSVTLILKRKASLPKQRGSADTKEPPQLL